MKFKIFGFALTAILLLSKNDGWAQSYAESAMLFSRTTPGGSARIQGMGGTQIALGGDYSSALSNPAGLGMFNKSEFTLSPGFSSLKISANYLTNTDETLTTKLNIPGLSLMFHLNDDNEPTIRSSVGISMTKVNDFNSSFVYHGTPDDPNTRTSIIDAFLGNATGDTESQFNEGNYNYNTPTGLAYYNYLIGPESLLSPPGSSTQYFSDVLIDSYPHQQENVQTTGGTNQWSFSYGGNYKDKLFFGGGIGISSLHYKSVKNYSEKFDGDTVSVHNLQLNENLDIRGSGLNLTVGAIGRPVDFIQIGLSYTTPTIYQLSEKYDASMSTSWKSGFVYANGDVLGQESAYTDIVTSNYSLTTTSKLSAGLAFISKYGLITGDLELTNPSGAKYGSITQGVSYTDDNKEIKSTYRRALNYRIGGEFRYSIFRARAGYGVQANAYKSTFDADNTIQTISGGVGVRTKKFFIDFALVSSQGKGLYSPYTGASVVDLRNNLTKGIFTVGFVF